MLKYPIYRISLNLQSISTISKSFAHHYVYEIIYGMNDEATYIPLIDPITFAEIGQIATTNIATAVEIEKFDWEHPVSSRLKRLTVDQPWDLEEEW